MDTSRRALRTDARSPSQSQDIQQGIRVGRMHSILVALSDRVSIITLEDELPCIVRSTLTSSKNMMKTEADAVGRDLEGVAGQTCHMMEILC
eukprot:4649723-Prymnesium_polylepis.1